MDSEAAAREVVDFAREIIQVNSPSGKEDGVANLIKRKMEDLGYDQVRVDDYGNVIGVRQGTGSGPVILFDGHMDVVPVPHPENWESPPFSAEIRKGNIFGRGASDMKGPLAAAVVGLGRLPAADFTGTLVVSASVGEEIHEGAAVEKVVEQIHPDFVVICEPNGASLGIGQKGRAGLTVEALGKPAHSSVPHLGENALYKGMQIVERLRQMPLPSHPLLGEGVMEAIDGISYPYPSQSTVPVSFKMRYDRRLMDGETMQSVLDSIRAVLSDLNGWTVNFPLVRIDTYTGQVLEAPDFHPGWLIDPGSPWIQQARAGLVEAGIEPRETCARFCTNGSYTAGVAGIPTMIFGPSTGLLAHCDNEWIAIGELVEGLWGYQGLARQLCKVQG